MSKAHALLSASSAHRWLTCTKSAKLEEGFPNETSSYAEEGTAAHVLAEIEAKYAVGLYDQKELTKANKEFLANKAWSDYYSEEMREHAEAYGAFVKNEYLDSQTFCEDPVIEFETKIDFSEWVPEGFGTADCVIITDDQLEVIDFKYGKGVKVLSYENPQMMLYALGAYHQFEDFYDIQKIKMSIFQPRLGNEPVFYTISVDELLEWAEKVVKPAAKLAYKGRGEYAPSEEACRFCKVRGSCRARHNANMKVFTENPDLDVLTSEEIADVLKQAKAIKSWLADLENHAFKSLAKGEEIPGWKLVAGRSNRKITNSDAAVERLIADGIDEPLLYEKKLLSLAGMEKAFGKKYIAELLSDLIEKPQGSPTLAPESDNRPAITLEDAVVHAFDEEDDE